MNGNFRTMNEAIEQGRLLNEIEVKLHDYPTILFDDSVKMPSVNNSIKEFNCGEPIWEDMSDDYLSMECLSEDDLSNLLYEIDRQIEKDDKLMERCQGD